MAEGEQQTQVGSVPNSPTPIIVQEEQQQQQHIGGTNTPEEQPLQAEQPTQTGTKRKPCRPSSGVWDHFTKDGKNAICNYCGKSYACDGNIHGTTNLHKHLPKCAKNPNREADKKQKQIVLGKQGEGDPTTFKLAQFSQERSRAALAKMLVVDELPLRFVEYVGFKSFMSEAQPRLKIPSRRTITRDIMQLFIEEKVILKSLLSLNHQMVSLTTDTWTSVQNLNYMCVTAHYIDDGWGLNKKILSFGLISDHKGDTIGKALEICLKDWGINKVGTITVDNASSNNAALTYLVRNMSHWNGTTMLKGEYMHLRCCAHILNIIVCEGMKEIDCSIARIKAACKYVKGSPSRLASFKRCARDANLDVNQMVILDCLTRWNSTYLMLEAAEKYEKAFSRLEYEDQTFVNQLDSEGGPPNTDDWSRVRKFIQFLKIFYDATLVFSSSLSVTANTFFHQLCHILNTLDEWKGSVDVGMKNMALNMKIKFDKYWDIGGNLNYLFFVAVFLDPRYKLDFVKFCLSEMCDSGKCDKVLKKLNDVIKGLFDQYVSMHPYPVDDNQASLPSTEVISQSPVCQDINPAIRLRNKFREKVKKKQGELKTNELERYLEDDVEDDCEGFDILMWWKGKTSKYHVLSRMARDILPIPVSTVSSESAFSTGGRVLDPFRSCLNPSTVEALICTQNWLGLSNSNIYGELESPMADVEVDSVIAATV